MKFLVAACRTACTGLGKRDVLFTGRAYSQMIAPHQTDNARSKNAINKLFVNNCNGVQRMFQIFDTTFPSRSKCGWKNPQCHIDLSRAIEPCDQIKIPKLKGSCEKICLPCCKPIRTPVQCERHSYRANLCSGVEYKYPSYAQTIESIDCGIYKTDCCYPDTCKYANRIGYVKKLVPIREKQKAKLGIPPCSKKYFSTSAILNGKKCDSGMKKELPCLKKVPSSLKEEKKGADCRECPKMCIPCCKPCRDPPMCEFPYHKPPCKKLKAPRKSFSECQIGWKPKKSPCECQLMPGKKCHLISSQEGGKKCT